MNYLSCDENLKKLVEAFETGKLEQDEWHHTEHLAIGFWYLVHFTFLQAIFKIKLGLLKYNERYLVEQTMERGYHETVTLFFMKYLDQFVKAKRSESLPLVEKLRTFLDENRDFRSVLWKYYSRQRLNSLEARIQWVEPDLQPL